ncbi:hypothetical protein [Streptomyces yaizuensis]|uniref:DUF6317 family protein n=1 Tax=Streptomyces yaizuensis TaxID=2989713 RepID=A0ABQ5P725_9ACTN|nr:hypothetical protein [Streptomyces sp. YSPA8]GLF98402.1 DUF6317 family protein [Streptomyces sp. YSPA8]
MDLQVDTAGLARLAQALSRSLTALSQARNALERLRADQLGTPELDRACDGFQERWAYGAERLRDRIGSVHDGVGLSRAEYARVDAAITEAFRAVRPDA